MYIPTHFSEERVPVLHDLIRQHPLATLVAQGPRGLMANHIPMEIDPAPHPFGTLVGHVSRANPFWHSYSPDVEALAVFTGPHTYVSPSWYKTTQETGKVVPTWNYAVVHAYGPMRIIEDPAWLRRLVERLTERYESGRTQPWRITDAPDDNSEESSGSRSPSLGLRANGR